MRERLTLFVLCAAALFAAPAAAQSPQADDETRNLWDTAFLNAGRAPARKTAARRPASRRGYRVATPAVPPKEVAGDTVIGVTVWRLRRSGASDAGERLLVHEGGDAGEWLPERVSDGTRLVAGDRVRLSIEAARSGYLYVVDRELYADGTLGEPFLIFPTARTLGGRNEVSAGKLVELPAQTDSPPYFTLGRSRADHVGEVLSVIISPEPLAGLQTAAQAQRLSAAQVAEWESAWGARVGYLEMERGAGLAWTREEKQAGADAAKTLTAGAPGPQRLYYRPHAKPGEPLLVKVKLQYGPPARAGRR
jgi:hypothetical protein